MTPLIDEQVWDNIEEQIPRAPGVLRRRVREDSERNLFVGITYPGRERLLELAVSAEVFGDIRLPSTRALKTVREPGVAGEVEVRIILSAPEMAGVFTPFCNDVIEAVAATEDDRAAVSVLLERFAHWQRLFASEGGGLSSLDAQALFGELWVMEHLIMPLPCVQAIKAWRGPEREDRDFLMSGLGIEVKTTRGDEPAAVTIANEGQLDIVGLDALYLVALKLEVLQGGKGATLNDSVASMRAALVPEAVSLFRDKLLRYGYLDQHSNRYEDVIYVIREVEAFKVGEGFPRIIGKDLISGVGSVTYRLALSACEPWRQTVDELRSAVAMVASEASNQ